MVSREEAILKTKPGELGLATTGKKDELVARYVEATSAGEEIAETKDELEPEPAAAAAIVTEPETVDDNAEIQIEAAAPSTGGAKIVFPVSEAKKDTEEKQLTAEEKAKQRAERFGIVHPEIEKEKKLKRAERFGVEVPELEDAKKQKRAEKFAPISTAAAGKSSDSVADDIMKARAARFNQGSSSAVIAEEAEKLKKRAERFG